MPQLRPLQHFGGIGWWCHGVESWRAVQRREKELVKYLPDGTAESASVSHSHAAGC
jgi:hypothetical protein